MVQFDNELGNAKNYISNLVRSDSDLLMMAVDTEKSEKYYTLSKLQNNIVNTMSGYKYIDYFVLVIPSTDFSYLRVKDTSDLDQMNHFDQSLLKHSSEQAPGTYFSHLIHNNSDYCVIYTVTPDILCGYAINISKLQKKIPSELSLHFIATDQLDDIRSNIDSSELFLSADSSLAPVSVYTKVNSSDLTKTLPYLQKQLYTIPLFLLLILSVLVLLLNFIVRRPLNHLEKHIKQIKNGDWNHPVSPIQCSNEFMAVNQAFNTLMNQIENLKINVYEEQLTAEKNRLQGLQYQMRPHFMINTLNIIYNFIQNGNLTEAQQLIRFSTDYLRYMIMVDSDFVPLNQEISHLKNYLGIQAFRYENTIEYQIDADPFIEDSNIPPFLIQNIVENSIKYYNKHNEILKIRILVKYEESEYESFMHFTIRDNGEGYPAEILEQIKNRVWALNSKHIGLKNCMERLKLIYNESAEWHFYNDNGAVSEFILPILED